MILSPLTLICNLQAEWPADAPMKPVQPLLLLLLAGGAEVVDDVV